MGGERKVHLHFLLMGSKELGYPCAAPTSARCFYEGENMLVIHPDECIDCGVEVGFRRRIFCCKLFAFGTKLHEFIYCFGSKEAMTQQLCFDLHCG